ncbi:HEXXH motif domain-containing protein [Actinoallomurus liliacearum]|uniref:HEXXH motif domain-containing protein n=1 Tax=Actinoallomurus liliacearum TaxID=1080073 RepID=A0ABP8TMD1_9ACTN
MEFARRRLSPHDLNVLAHGSGGAPVARWLADTQLGRGLLLVWGVMDTARRVGHVEAERTRQAYRLLAELQRRHPEEAEAVLGHPATGAWALGALRALQGAEAPGRPRTDPAGLSALAAAVMIRAGVRGAVRVPAADGAVMLPSLGRADVPGDEVLVRSSGRGAEVTAPGVRVAIPADPRTDAPGWHGLRTVTASAHGFTIRAVLDDLDAWRLPGAMVGARLGGAEVAEWRSLLEEAWEVLTCHHWTTATECQTIVRALVPLLAPSSGQRSASSRETFGAVGTSRPVDALGLAVTFAHEVQHAKLAAVLDTVSLIRSDSGRRYYAPWREDPRPVEGLLQGAYAHLGVSGFWRRQRHHERGMAAMRAHAQFARWRTAALRVTRTLLASGELTDEGMAFATGMRRTLEAWEAEHVPAPALLRARREAEQHRTRWRLRNCAASESG